MNNNQSTLCIFITTMCILYYSSDNHTLILENRTSVFLIIVFFSVIKNTMDETHVFWCVDKIIYCLKLNCQSIFWKNINSSIIFNDLTYTFPLHYLKTETWFTKKVTKGTDSKKFNQCLLLDIYYVYILL